MALGFRVNTLVVVVLEALRDAVTPAGIPDTDRITLLLSPVGLTTLIVLLALAPPTRRVRLLAEAESAASEFPVLGMVSAIVALFVAVAEVPVTVTAYVPGTAVALGFRVSVLVVLVLEALRDAATPAGIPDTDRSTFPLSPTGLTTLIVLLALALADEKGQAAGRGREAETRYRDC